MIIGSGLLARAFSDAYSEREDVCVYAAGVSNSGCTDPCEFEREHLRLEDALQKKRHVDTFVYFGTCSVADPDVENTPYVQHKLAMEKMVSAHPHYLILRLPQVAGITPNPHTLLNFLYARISRSECFDLWSKAKRNIIDVEDVALIGKQLIENKASHNTIYNIANIDNYSMPDIVAAVEVVVGKRAVYNVVERGADYFIDTTTTYSTMDDINIIFDNQYLEKVIRKYCVKLT